MILFNKHRLVLPHTHKTIHRPHKNPEKENQDFAKKKKKKVFRENLHIETNTNGSSNHPNGELKEGKQKMEESIPVEERKSYEQP